MNYEVIGWVVFGVFIVMSIIPIWWVAASMMASVLLIGVPSVGILLYLESKGLQGGTLFNISGLGAMGFGLCPFMLILGKIITRTNVCD